MVQMEVVGYMFRVVFIILENCWIDYYYSLQIVLWEVFLEKYFGNFVVKAFIENDWVEVDLYECFKQYYSYVFYIG